MPRKPRPEGTRAPNGAGSIYQGADGRWHGRVTMGVRDDGSPDRRHVSGKTESGVLAKIRKLEKDRDSGRFTRPGRPWTVERWLTHWVENIAAPSVRENTLSGYRVAVNVHLIPGIGGHRLDKLQPEHLERLYARNDHKGQRAGNCPSSAPHGSYSPQRSCSSWAHFDQPCDAGEGTATVRRRDRALHRG